MLKRPEAPKIVAAASGTNTAVTYDNKTANNNEEGGTSRPTAETKVSSAKSRPRAIRRLRKGKNGESSAVDQSEHTFSDWDDDEEGIWEHPLQASSACLDAANLVLHNSSPNLMYEDLASAAVITTGSSPVSPQKKKSKNIVKLRNDLKSATSPPIKSPPSKSRTSVSSRLVSSESGKNKKIVSPLSPSKSNRSPKLPLDVDTVPFTPSLHGESSAKSPNRPVGSDIVLEEALLQDIIAEGDGSDGDATDPHHNLGMSYQSLHLDDLADEGPDVEVFHRSKGHQSNSHVQGPDEDQFDGEDANGHDYCEPLYSRGYASTSRFDEFLDPHGRSQVSSMPLRGNASMSALHFYDPSTTELSHFEQPCTDSVEDDCHLIVDTRSDYPVVPEDEDISGIDPSENNIDPVVLLPSTLTTAASAASARNVPRSNRQAQSSTAAFYASATSLNLDELYQEDCYTARNPRTAVRVTQQQAQNRSHSSVHSGSRNYSTYVAEREAELNARLAEEEEQTIRLAVERSLEDSHSSYQDDLRHSHHRHPHYDGMHSSASSASRFASEDRTNMSSNNSSFVDREAISMSAEEERQMINLALEISLRDADASSSTLQGSSSGLESFGSSSNHSRLSRHRRSEHSSGRPYRDQQPSHQPPARPHFPRGNSLLQGMVDYENEEEDVLFHNSTNAGMHPDRWAPSGAPITRADPDIAQTSYGTRPMYQWERELATSDHRLRYDDSVNCVDGFYDQDPSFGEDDFGHDPGWAASPPSTTISRPKPQHVVPASRKETRYAEEQHWVRTSKAPRDPGGYAADMSTSRRPQPTEFDQRGSGYHHEESVWVRR